MSYEILKQAAAWAADGRGCGTQAVADSVRSSTRREMEALHAVLEWSLEDCASVMATVIAVSGNSPCRVGTRLAISEEGSMVGSLGGVGLEAMVEDRLPGILPRREPALVEWVYRGDGDWVESMEDDGFVEAKVTLLLESFCPQGHIAIFGAGPVGSALARLCEAIAMPYRIYDDRPEVMDGKFQGAMAAVCEPWSRILSGLRAGASTWGVVATAGHLHDAEVAAALLSKSTVPYVGVMHNPRKAMGLAHTIVASGATPDKRFHCPIGLSIARHDPGEIALAILAEIIALRNGGQPVHNRLEWEAYPVSSWSLEAACQRG